MQTEIAHGSLQPHVPFQMRLGVYDTPVFHALIRHERSRIDRTNGEFENVEGRDHRMREVRDRLLKAMRSIDEIGWLNEHVLGVLLPSTDIRGGEAFACRIVEDCSKRGARIQHKVYTYPDNWIPSYSRDPKDCMEGEENAIELPEAFRIVMPKWKRWLDVGGSLLAILLLFPLMLMTAMYIKVVSPGPAIFKQRRVGYGGKTFTFLKFRTMHPDNDASGHMGHIVARIRANESLDKYDDADPRIIPGGRFLRSSCIDELPQLFNVLRGEMSLVGPRPCVLYEAREYLMWHNHRFDVLPGMTGLWQVSGKSHLTFLEMMRLDIAYTEHLSFWSDVVILLRTVPTIAKLVAESAGRRIRKRTMDAKGSMEGEATS